MLEYLTSKGSKSTLPLVTLSARELPAWRKQQPDKVKRWLQSVSFQARPGERCLIPGNDGAAAQAVVGIANPRDPWSYAALPALLPKGRYRLAVEPDATVADAVALGWALGTYEFTRYKATSASFATLVWPQHADQARVSALVEATGLCRDLINTPAEDLGPHELVEAGVALGKRHGGKTKVLRGEKELKELPAVYAVGRASSRPPELLDLSWGDAKNPKVTLVGKGVVFDTGGLNIKATPYMKLMKKDMGGAALVLALSHVIMALGLPVRLRTLVPAVENSISGNAMRPLDVLNTRKGLTVEIGNTDAEGRLILCDALTLADEEQPELLIDAATLTGAARIALGTGLPALFSSQTALARELIDAGEHSFDPLWHMPLHEPYDKQLDSKVADLNNISSSEYGGAIIAALFLKRFIAPTTPWLHIDTMGWNLEGQPGRPVGGEALGLRALTELLIRRYPRT
ncbi:MAG: leucyl aminopeptidase family protein [Polyangiaceae bacterium]